MEIAYYPGCSLDASSKLYDVQTRLVLDRLGVTLKELDDWSCCGATSASKTDEFLAIALPARNLGIADQSGLKELVIPCSSCYNRLAVSQKVLKDDAELRTDINAELEKKVTGHIKVLNILEFIMSRAESGDIAQKTVKKLEGLKPACYYGCLQTRFPCDIDIPYNVENPQAMENVCKIIGAEPVDWAYKTDCCGASASVNDAELSFKLMAKIFKDAVSRGANCFVMTCPMCQLNLDAYQEQVCNLHGIDKRLPVFFLTELLGLAFGLSMDELKIRSHFSESAGLLKELNLI